MFCRKKNVHMFSLMLNRWHWCWALTLKARRSSVPLCWVECACEASMFQNLESPRLLSESALLAKHVSSCNQCLLFLSMNLHTNSLPQAHLASCDCWCAMWPSFLSALCTLKKWSRSEVSLFLSGTYSLESCLYSDMFSFIKLYFSYWSSLSGADGCYCNFTEQHTRHWCLNVSLFYCATL